MDYNITFPFNISIDNIRHSLAWVEKISNISFVVSWLLLGIMVASVHTERYYKLTKTLKCNME